ncbi:sensor histidine kinase [Nocardia cyriacigeorgica]|uniref:sensor histidine kinase n=1 Tax=Nocardia cyriacigeorgica TaxID=135487 RepID=UPI001E3962FB|nr:histidine kinase [Nocardia cyriacigeorgica]
MDSSDLTRWLESWLDPGHVPARCAILLAAGIGCLALVSESPSAVDWGIGLIAITAASGVRWPLARSLFISALLLTAFQVGDTGPLVVKVAAAIALAELAARRDGPQIVWAALALGAAYLLHPADDVAGTVYRAVVMATAPLLVGMLLRAARRSAEHARREMSEQAAQRDAEVAAARAVERTAIARELHDLLAHHVSSSVLRVGVAIHACPDAPREVLEVLEEIHASGRETLIDLRRLVSILRDPDMTGEPFIAPADLPAAVLAAVERAGQLGVAVDYVIDHDTVVTVDAVSALTLLRLTQEGLANVVKHAGPGARVRLVIEVGEGEIAFCLDDDGGSGRGGSVRHGLDLDGHGLGLVGLRERVHLLGGDFAAEPEGNGWRMGARLPVGSRVPS